MMMMLSHMYYRIAVYLNVRETAAALICLPEHAIIPSACADEIVLLQASIHRHTNMAAHQKRRPTTSLALVTGLTTRKMRMQNADVGLAACVTILVQIRALLATRLVRVHISCRQIVPVRRLLFTIQRKYRIFSMQAQYLGPKHLKRVRL